MSDDSGNPPINGAIHVMCAILKNMMTSAAETETGAVFINCQKAISIRQTLVEMSHPQPATPVHVDNKCAVGILNETIQQRKSKSIDARFLWVRDRVKQGQFRVLGGKGDSNLADYLTKHQFPVHHKKMRGTYVPNHIFFAGTHQVWTMVCMT